MMCPAAYLLYNHIYFAAAIMGGIGCIAVITMIFRYQALRKTTSTRLVFFQTFTYLVESVFNVALPSDQPRACTIQAVVVEFAMLSSALWGCVMIYVLYSIMVRAPTSRLAYDPNSELHWFHLVCWGLPMPMTIAPLITGAQSNTTSVSLLYTLNNSLYTIIIPSIRRLRTSDERKRVVLDRPRHGQREGATAGALWHVLGHMSVYRRDVGRRVVEGIPQYVLCVSSA